MTCNELWEKGSYKSYCPCLWRKGKVDSISFVAFKSVKMLIIQIGNKDFDHLIFWLTMEIIVIKMITKVKANIFTQTQSELGLTSWKKSHLQIAY